MKKLIWLVEFGERMNSADILPTGIYGVVLHERLGLTGEAQRIPTQDSYTFL